jgi:hypothetical protein
MTSAAAWRLQVGKEVRPLLLPALASIAIMLASRSGVRPLEGLAIAAYFIGMAAIGALSVGHEYSHRTWPLLLMLPVSRRRLLLVKQGVLAAVLVLVAVTAHVLLLLRLPSEGLVAAIVWPIACGLWVAPWLTMLSGRAIAGTVFTAAAPGVIYVAGLLIGTAIYGEWATNEIFAFTFAMLRGGLFALCVTSAVLLWRAFTRLELTGADEQALQLPVSLRRSDPAEPAASRRHPVWAVAAKEVRLQQLPLALGVLYLLAWVPIAILTGLRPQADEPLHTFALLSVLYVLLVCLLAGSVASAEERQTGTLEGQLLLPMRSSVQWTIKVAVAAGVALLVAGVVPTILLRLVASPTWLSFPGPAPLVALSLIVIAFSLYVSSSSPTSLRALLTSLAAGYGLIVIWYLVSTRILERIAVHFGALGTLRRFNDGLSDLFLARTPIAWALFGSCILLLMRFALTNHRSAERSAFRIAAHVLWMVAGVVAAAVVLSILDAPYRLAGGR